MAKDNKEISNHHGSSVIPVSAVNVVCSVCLIAANKYVLGVYKFPALVLTFLHFICTGFMSWNEARKSEPAPVPWLYVFTCAGLSTVSIVLSNLSLLYNQVSEYQVFIFVDCVV